MTEIEFLANIAYMAYMESIGVKDLPVFKYTPKVVQAGWVAAVEAVLDNAQADCTHHIKEEDEIDPKFMEVHTPSPLQEAYDKDETQSDREYALFKKYF